MTRLLIILANKALLSDVYVIWRLFFLQIIILKNFAMLKKKYALFWSDTFFWNSYKEDTLKKISVLPLIPNILYYTQINACIEVNRNELSLSVPSLSFRVPSVCAIFFQLPLYLLISLWYFTTHTGWPIAHNRVFLVLFTRCQKHTSMFFGRVLNT